MFEKWISFAGQNVLVVNLTEPLREDLSVFPGDPTPKKSVVASIEKNGCQYHVYSIGDHHFHPHGDAPNHHNPEYSDRGFEYWDMEYAFNLACIVDLSNMQESREIHNIRFLTQVTERHLFPHQNRLRECAALLIRTGYDRWIEANYPHDVNTIPYLDSSASDFLAQFKNLRVIGVDSLTVDKPGMNYSHRKLKDRFIVECLVHLYKIPLESKPFLLQTSPIAIRGATGGPVAAYAYFVK